MVHCRFRQKMTRYKGIDMQEHLSYSGFNHTIWETDMRFTFDARVFKQTMREALTCVAKNTDRPVLQAVFMEFKPPAFDAVQVNRGECVVRSADGYRAYRRTIPVTTDTAFTENVRLCVTGLTHRDLPKSMVGLDKIVSRIKVSQQDSVVIEVLSNGETIRIDNHTVPLIEGLYPDIDSVIPNYKNSLHYANLTVDRKGLKILLKDIESVAKNNANNIKMHVERTQPYFYSHYYTGIGDEHITSTLYIHEYAPYSYSSSLDKTVSFNYVFLLDIATKVKDSILKVYIRLDDKDAPFMVTTQNAEWIIMPSTWR